MTYPIQSLPVSSLRKGAPDVDIDSFNLQMRTKGGIKLVSAITGANIDKTIEGASTLVVTVDDDDLEILNSGRLGRKVDVNVDGLWWTLVSVKKSGKSLTLTFEEREVNVLRYYNSFLMGNRAQITRAEFVLRMIKEVKEIPLKWVIPELTTKQLVSDLTDPNQILVTGSGQPVFTGASASVQGIPAGSQLTVKGNPANVDQIRVANIVLQTGVSLSANRKVLISSIMTGIDESELTNLVGGDRDSVGVFQQRPSQGWPATRDIPTDAAAYFKQAIALDKQNPGMAIELLCQGVQRSFDKTGSNYAAFYDEAVKFVNDFGVTPSTPTTGEKGQGGNPIGSNNQQDASSQIIANAQSGQYYFRGQITAGKTQGNYLLTKENSWLAMNRLASEVNWRAFCVNGVIYFVSETWIFKSKPMLTITEGATSIRGVTAVEVVDGDYDEGKKEATLEVSCHISRWSAPPGTIIKVVGMGIFNGKWIVNDFARSVYDSDATITLTKPLPVLPEPTSLSTLPQGFSGPQATPQGARNGTGPTVPANQIQQSIVSYAKAQLGLPYKWGAEIPGVAFDCSGLTQAAYNSVGISIPRVAQAQYDAGPVVSQADVLQPGDLVFFGNPSDSGGLHHVAIYIGNGAVIHAPQTGEVVRVQENFMTAFGDYYGATRPWQS